MTAKIIINNRRNKKKKKKRVENEYVFSFIIVCIAHEAVHGVTIILFCNGFCWFMIKSNYYFYTVVVHVKIIIHMGFVELIINDFKYL